MRINLDTEIVGIPNAIEILLDVMNSPEFDVTSVHNKLLMYRACHEYQHVCDPDPDHTWMDNYKNLERRRGGDIDLRMIPAYGRYCCNPQDTCDTGQYNSDNYIVRYVTPSNGSCTPEKAASWGINRNFLWNIEGYIEQDVKVLGFTCPLVMSPTSRRVSPHKCYWLHKKIEEVSHSATRKNVPLKWDKGFRYRPEVFDAPKSKRLLGLPANDLEVYYDPNRLQNYKHYVEIAYERRVGAYVERGDESREVADETEAKQT